MNRRDLVATARTQRTPARFRGEADAFVALHREMNRLFDDLLRGLDLAQVGGMGPQVGWPPVEVVATDNDVRVCAELPGVDENDVEVLLQDSVLTIRGQKRSDTDDKERSYSERFYGRFERRIPLPREVEQDKVAASFTNGVLTVTIPRSARPERRVKRIAVNGENDETRH